MQKMMGLMRKCIEDYDMIQPGDRVAVGVSGGKDSLTLLVVLAALREYYPAKFDLAALSVDMGLGGMDFSPEKARNGSARRKNVQAKETRMISRNLPVLILQPPSALRRRESPT